MVTIGSNLAASRAIRRLGEASDTLASTFERLSSGERINKASDDAAGLAVSSRLRTDARVFTQATRNVNDGLSLLAVADGALESLTDIATRLRELATQSSNGTFSNKQREALDTEAQALSKEYNRIARGTTFNGLHLFDASFGEVALQVGYGQLTSGLGGTIGTGRFYQSGSLSLAGDPYDIVVTDLNRDGIQDIAAADSVTESVAIFIGNGDGTFAASRSYAVGDPEGIAIGDFNSDGVKDIVSADRSTDTLSILFGRGDGTFAPRTTLATYDNPRLVAVGDFNGDGLDDLVATNNTVASVSVLYGRGGGTFSAARSYASGAGAIGVVVADFNGDGLDDFATSGRSDDSVNVHISRGDDTFAAAVSYAGGDDPYSLDLGDFNGDGIDDLVTKGTGDSTVNVLLGAGDGTFASRISFNGASSGFLTTGDFNGDGNLDTVSAAFNRFQFNVGAGDGTFSETTTVITPPQINWASSGDLNRDGVQEVLLSNLTTDTIMIFSQETADGIPALLPFSLARRSSALDALPYLSDTLDRLSAQRGEIGAFQARARVAVSQLSSLSLAAKEAESRITDTDIAHDSAELARQSIVQRAAQSVLAQANLEPRIALSLLT